VTQTCQVFNYILSYVFSISIDVLQAYLFLNKYQVIFKSNKLQIPKRKTCAREL